VVEDRNSVDGPSSFWGAPIAGFAARRPLAGTEKPRVLIYAASAANLIVIGALTALVDIKRGGLSLYTVNWAMPLSRFLAWSVGLSIALIVISLGVFAIRRKLNRPPTAIVMSLLPQTAAERAVFLAVCLLVGFVEEFLFRGFAFFTIARFSASPGSAAAIVTISFALQHGIQDVIGIIRAFVLGVLLLIAVVMTGSLLPSMMAHAVVDAFSGLCGRAAMKSVASK
jgi:membrane protease YdiL (CAAX protease family)